MANTYKALSTVTVGAGGVASISFTNIPQTYTDLVVKISARTSFYFIGCIINNEIGNYYRQNMGGDGSTASATNAQNTQSAYTQAMFSVGNALTANTFTNSEFYFPNYTNNAYPKSANADSVAENNATAGYSWLSSVMQTSTNPITNLTFFVEGGTSNSIIYEYSTFTLYGVFNADVASAPTTPTIGTATASGSTSASITFTGVNNAASYTMTSTPSSITGTGTNSPIVVNNLKPATSYTFKVKANNPFGSSGESAASNSITTSAAAFESIATTTVSSAVSFVEFTSIPSTFTHLQIRGVMRNSSGTRFNMQLRFNGDTGNNYAWSFLQAGDTNNISGGDYGSLDSMQIASGAGNASTSNVFSPLVIDILDYKNTNKYKTARGISGHDASGSGSAWVRGGLWLSTSAISSIRLIADGANFMTNSTFALYGIKAV